MDALSTPDRDDRPDPGSVVPVEPVNGFRILQQVVDLPISTWRYEWEEPHVRHLGPMAQDWAAAFGLGDDEAMIAVVDASGVALVSVQALHALVGELRQEVADLRRQIDARRDVGRPAESSARRESGPSDAGDRG